MPCMLLCNACNNHVFCNPHLKMNNRKNCSAAPPVPRMNMYLFDNFLCKRCVPYLSFGF